MSSIDTPTDVREGEELDEDALVTWLANHLSDFDGDLEVLQFPAGHSNLTYLVRLDDDEYVLRRPPHGVHVDSGHDMAREWKVLSALDDVYDKGPRPVAFCDDDSILGAPFYLMERVEGVILRGADPDVPELEADTMGALSESFVDELAALHGLDWRAAGLDDFGRPDGYLDRQVDGWIDRYEQSQTDDIDQMDAAAAWMREHKPDAEAGAALIHNDYKYDNLVLDPWDYSKIRAILDWEMATIGDPLMDLGTTLAYWVEPDDPEVLQQLQFGPTAKPGNFTRRELVDYYADVSGRDVSNILFYYVYGLYKVAVIGQQIYYRFRQGHTDDPRFAALIHAVRALAVTAERAIDRGSID